METKFRPDAERIRASKGEPRPLDRLMAHYEIESKLAERLAGSDRPDRSALYATSYDELFARVSDHPQHRRKSQNRSARLQAQADLLLARLDARSTYVEIGCGDAALTKLVAARVGRAIGVDVTPALVSGEAPPAFEFLRTDGITLALADDTADLVFSNQLMEHLHADDAATQLQDIVRILKPGGRYVCCTPNRLTGPHDISVYFSYEPKGFHLKEYDHASISRLFRSAGFRTVQAMLMVRGRAAMLPVAPFIGVERLLRFVPTPIRRTLVRRRAIEQLLGVNVIGVK